MAVGLSLSAIQTLLAIAVPVIGGLITLAVWFHRRLQLLESTSDEERGVSQFFGEPDMPLSISLAKEVRDIKEWQADAKEDHRELRQHVEDMDKKLDRIDEKLDGLKED